MGRCVCSKCGCPVDCGETLCPRCEIALDICSCKMNTEKQSETNPPSDSQLSLFPKRSDH